MAILNLYGDGSCGLYISTVDMGQGSDTVMAQIVAETLETSAESIRVIHPDTDMTPYDMGTLGSRSTFHMGTAVKLAAEEVKRKTAELALELGLAAGHNLTVAELLRKKYGMQAGNIIGVGSFIPPYEKPAPGTGQSAKATPFWGVSGAAAEVEVDCETGKVTVTRLFNIADVGTAINPKLVEAQISGASIMQLGFTMTEEMVFKNGQLTNGSLADYKIPTMLDLPREFVNGYVDSKETRGPFGAKGAGESAMIALSPAIGNAVADAIGVHPMNLPLTSEGIYQAISRRDAVTTAQEA